MDTLELYLHPLRMRIVHAMAGGQARTTSDLCTRMPEVPKTSVYRHVGLLADAGVLEVVDEQRVHGAVERYYRISANPPAIADEAATAMSLDDHRGGFAAAMSILMAEFNAYLNRDDADPAADLLGYKQGVLWLSPEELTELVSEVLVAMRKRADNKPAPGRRPRLISMIHFPTAEPD
jgi:DNA-binding transcriptional ArsR family regulator